MTIQNSPSGEKFSAGASPSTLFRSGLSANAHRQQAGSYRGRYLARMHGFTLVELITVMVIVGILAVAVLPRFFTVSTFEDRGSADQVKALLKFAQKTAIAQHTNIAVDIAQSTPPDCTTTLCNSTTTPSCATPKLTCKVKSSAPTKTVTFDALGRPVPNAAASATVGGTTITIEGETGYVH